MNLIIFCKKQRECQCPNTSVKRLRGVKGQLGVLATRSLHKRIVVGLISSDPIQKTLRMFA